MYGYLACFGLKYDTRHADYIAYVHSLERGIVLFTDVVAADVYLYVALTVQEMRKTRLAHYAL